MYPLGISHLSYVYIQSNLLQKGASPDHAPLYKHLRILKPAGSKLKPRKHE